MTHIALGRRDVRSGGYFISCHYKADMDKMKFGLPLIRVWVDQHLGHFQVRWVSNYLPLEELKHCIGLIDHEIGKGDDV